MKTILTLAFCMAIVVAAGSASAEVATSGIYTEQGPAASMIRAEPVMTYGYPAEAGRYASQPINPGQPSPGPAMARAPLAGRVAASAGIAPPPRRISKCRPEAAFCGPQPCPPPFMPAPCGPAPVCGPVFPGFPATVMWY